MSLYHHARHHARKHAETAKSAGTHIGAWASFWGHRPHIRYSSTALLLSGLLFVSILMGTTVPAQEAQTEGGTLAATAQVSTISVDVLQTADVLKPVATVSKVAEPTPPPAKVVAASGDSAWDTLAACESHNNWADNTGNGYYGGLQMSQSIWNGNGGPQFAARPDLASREQQIVVANNIHAKSGFGPWPYCARKAGLL